VGPWAEEVDGSDVVVNLAGRNVSCRYTAANLRAMMDSRVQSAHVAPNDEATGVLGGAEPGVPGYWAYSVEIAKNWERAQEQSETPRTRKVALRSAMVMSPTITISSGRSSSSPTGTMSLGR
jgi:NAD dependent epimerase/dehydratase family enzyme